MHADSIDNPVGEKRLLEPGRLEYLGAAGKKIGVAAVT